MRILAVDYGERRIGLAMGDGETGIGFPIRTLSGLQLHDAVSAVVAEAAGQSVDTVVVGMPYRMTGEGGVGEIQQAVLTFIEALKPLCPVPIDTEDERLTTAMVERMRRDAGIRGADFDRDAAAAAAIAESYLARRKEHPAF